MKKIAFFTYLMLEYGGGVATYFTDIAQILQQDLPHSQISIITFDEKLLRKFLFIYTLYFKGQQDQYRYHKESPDLIIKKLEGIIYIKVSSIAELMSILAFQEYIYTTNNLIELLLTSIFRIYHKQQKVIIGFHIPILYTIPTTMQTKIHNMLYKSFIYSYLLNAGSSFHTLNTFTTDYLKKKFPKKNISLLYTPFQLTHPVKKNSNKTHKKYTILWVGRLTEQKGVDRLIAIIDNVHERYQKNIQWMIIGDGELRERITNIQKKHDNISYLGYIPHQKLPLYYKSSDLFIMTSISESYPFTLLEAQIYGLFSIAYAIPGCTDIIQQNKTGFLVNSNDEFVTKITYSIKRRVRLKRQPNFSYEERRRKLLSLFNP